MKGLYLIITLVWVASASIHAQIMVTHEGSSMIVKSNTLMHINGGMETQGSGSANKITNEGIIQLTDSLVNSGTEHFFGDNPADGKLRLLGDTLQLIIGTDTIHFNDLELSNVYDTLVLEDDIWVKDSLIIVDGNVFLNGHEVMLKTTGTIANESNTDRIYGSFPGVVSLERNISLTNPNLGGMGMDVAVDGGGASIRINRMNEVQTGVSNGSIERFYEVIPSAVGTVDYPANMGYFDSNDLGGLNEDSLHLYGSDDDGVSWRDKGGTANTTLDRLEYTEDSILNLSPGYKTYFTLADSSCLSPPSIVIQEDTIPICSGNPAWLVADSTSGKEIIWSDISGNILSYNVDSIQVTGVGSYVVMAVDSRGCDAKDTVVVSATSDPTVSFSEPSVCLGESINFSPTGTSIDSFYWDFGVISSITDTSTLQNPIFTYTQPNTYTVTLTVFSDLGCEFTYVNNVIVKPYPTADFMVPGGCADSIIEFENTSSDLGIASQVWDFDTLGGGATSGAQDPTYAYPDTGTFTIELIVSLSGCKDTAYQTVSIFPNPKPNFTFTGGSCPDDLIAFDNTTPPVGMVDYEWDFGDGTPTTNLLDPDHSFASSGTYSVVLTASTNKGCVNDTTILVEIDDVPNPVYAVANGCEGTVFDFAPTITVPGDTYSWSFGDGGSATTSNPSYVYPAYGTYTTDFVVTSANGCKDSSSLSVEVFPNPAASFTVDNGCQGTSFDYFNTSNIFPGSSATLTYSWLLPGGGVSTNTNENQVLNTPGTYPVQLVTISLDGCKDTVIGSVEVYANPTETILGLGSSGTTCGDSAILFISPSFTGTVLWSNGSTNDSIIADFDGNYSVTITSSAPANCIGQDDIDVFLNANVIVDLGVDTTICNSFILDAGYDSTSSTILWTGSAISPGSIVTDQFLEVTASGTYTVSVTDQNGCDTTDVITMTVNQSTPIDVAASDTIYQCQGLQQILSDGGVAGTYTWSTGQIADTIYVSASTAIDSLVSVVMENADGCFSYDTVTVSFNPTPIVDFGPSDSFCDSVLLDMTNAGATYIWYQDGIILPTELDSALLVTTSGVFSGVAALGSCSDSAGISITVNASPSITISDGTIPYGTDTILCSYENITLDAGVGANYDWSNAETTQTITVTATGIYAVEVTDGNGCKGKDSIDVTVNPIFEVDLGEDQTLCIGSETTLYSGVNNGTYQWNGSGGIIGIAQNILVSDTGIFWIDVYDSIGCRSIDSVTLFPTNLSLFAVFLAQTDVFVGDSVKFVNLSYPRPYDSFWKIQNHSDGTRIPYTDSTPIHVYTGDTGLFEAQLVVTNPECIDTARKTIHVREQVKTNPEIEENLQLFNEIEAINLYPNPNNGAFNLYLRLKEPGTAEISIFNMMGQLLNTKTNLLQEETLVYQMRERAGMYIVRVRVRESVKTVKFIMFQ